MNIARRLMSRHHRPAFLAACSFLVASVLMAGLSDESSKPVPPAPQAASAPPASGPRIAVDPPAFDFGRTLPQKAVTREFSIRNLGERDLVIETVSTSCGCTVTDQLAGKVVKPGGSLPLRVTLTTPAGPGAITKSVMVRSNDPARPLLEIKLKTTVAAAAR
jgi:uncharacterized protein DUF1573